MGKAHRHSMKSIDITPYIHVYRGTIMPLWKSLVQYRTQEYDWDLCDDFADICDSIFNLTVLRPNEITGVKKAKQYDQIPRGIPSFIVIPFPETRELLIAENNNGSLISRIEKYKKEENQTFVFVDLFDFDLCSPNRKFDHILAKIIKPYPTEKNNQYALLPIETTRVLWES